MITVDQLKDKKIWRQTSHADGRGYAVTFFQTEINGRVVMGWRRTGKAPGVGYSVGVMFACNTLEQVVAYLNLPFEAGDDSEARED